MANRGNSLSERLAWEFSYDAGFISKREKVERCKTFGDLDSEVAHYHFCPFCQPHKIIRPIQIPGVGK